MEKNYRIHTSQGDTILNVNMTQDFDFLEVLSLKLNKKDSYRLHSSNYGVIAGRVLANDAFGIPNAKVSLFIQRDTSDSNEMKDIYPYSEVVSRDKNSIRYNLLPDYSDDICYRVVGTFPRKRYMLDDNVQLEVYDKYWKYTTVTNNAGDYMLFGVPAGGHQVHVDIDLSDIGILSQKPSDFVFKGYTLESFDSPSQFKSSTNLDGLQQIISQNKSTNVYPFWGDAENGIAAITRCDIQVTYKFEPTCVFMGSIVSDNEENSIGHKCSPTEDNGLNSQLIAGEGTIEMIRKTQDGLVESFAIKGNALIDSDGVWCYQIPMNLDYVGTDEYGNIVPTDDPKRGIPTRTQVRFRISKNETGDEGFSRHTAKYLVPMNPELDETKEEPYSQAKTGVEIEKMYNFGSNTPQNCFRDLYWNNVYSVKNFIPKVQVAHRPYANTFGALKGSNLVDNQNPIPFNKLRFNLPFVYIVLCILYTIMTYVVAVINAIISFLHYLVYEFCFTIPVIKVKICPFKILIGWFIGDLTCVTLSVGSDNREAYYPGCSNAAMSDSSCPEDMEKCTKSNNIEKLLDRVQQNLASDYKIVKLDFYQDWLNGCLYMPLWYWRKRKKKTFLFGLFSSGAKNEFCDCDRSYSRLKTYVTCNMTYNNNSLSYFDSDSDEREDRWHKNKRQWVRYKNGLIKGVTNKDGLTAYYYVGYQPDNRDLSSVPILQRTRPFRIVRLYATDIILIGNLNEDNIYGIPQLFKSLPSTTANIPPVATIEESATDNFDDEEYTGDPAAATTSESGLTITTGMDWGHDGDSQTPRYQKGLFMDLTCTSVGTAPKSCINVERLGELSVNPDMRFSVSYTNGGNGIKLGTIDADGMINKLELDDLDNRATFATLNHIGFVPQDYQQTLDGATGTTTQVIDENTGYLVPKFKYIYPVDFDGRLNQVMTRYKGGFEQAMYDDSDESYLTFRLGAERDTNAMRNLEHRVRHFYYTNRGKYEMPLYNNSYYFYFGINKGNTAIDKFNKMFYSPCFQNNVNPFSFTIEALGKSFCPSTYPSTGGYNGYGYIRFTSDDITIPLKYTLYDSASNLVIEESDVDLTDFVIGGTINSDGKVVCNENGVIKYQMPGEEYQGSYRTGLTNQTYTLIITDGNGRKLSERIDLKVPIISLNYETESLGTRFYNTGSTRMDYICTDENQLYGKIRLKTFSIDGFEYYITGATVLAYDGDAQVYKIRLDGMSCEFNINEETGDLTPIRGTIKYGSAIVRVGTLESFGPNWVKDCMCDKTNSVYPINGGGSFISKATVPYWFGVVDYSDAEEKKIHSQKEVLMFVYQPNKFTLKITQMCDETEVEGNTSDEIAAVNNGNTFNTFLNTMPIKFMLGTTTDSSGSSVANNSYFYKSKVITEPSESGVCGWYGVHQEDTYTWNKIEHQVLKRNEDMWSDFVNIFDVINNHSVKSDILRFKFNTMFSLSRGVYIASNATRLNFSAIGGISPILYRSVIPYYNKSDLFVSTVSILSENNVASCPEYLPNIVAANYYQKISTIFGTNSRRDIGNPDNRKPYFNEVFGGNFYKSNSKVIGNYFAAFTNNGGYTSKTEVDTRAKVIQQPNYAKVTPWTSSGDKRLGKNVEGKINTFEPAYNKTSRFQPYLRALTVDRRLDYNLNVFTSCPPSIIRLYPKTRDNQESGKELIWRYGRISGSTYNGIEMSYDKDYNIISADTEYYIPEHEDDIRYSSITDAVSAVISSNTIVISGETDVEISNMASEHIFMCPENYMYYIPEIDNTTFYENKGEAIAIVSGRTDILTRGDREACKRKAAANHVAIYKNSASANTRLEYSYNYSDRDEDAKTYYNNANDMIWEEKSVDVQSAQTLSKIGGGDLLDCSGNPLVNIDGTPYTKLVYSSENETLGLPVIAVSGDPKGQIIKRFYEASFGGADIRNFFWSTFNKANLSAYTASEGDINSGTTNYVYRYPSGGTQVVYNGDFNRVESSSGRNANYPTIRYIDIGNIPSTNVSDLIIENCSYSMKATNEDDLLFAETRDDGGLDVSITYGSPVTFIHSVTEGDFQIAVAEIGDTGYNLKYIKNGTKPINGKTYTKFTKKYLFLKFSINSTSDENHSVYPLFPRLIKVLPYPMNNYDGISLIKTTTPNGEVASNRSLDWLISDDRNNPIVLHVFKSLSSEWVSSLFSGRQVDTICPGNVHDDNIEYPNGYENSNEWRYVNVDQTDTRTGGHKQITCDDTDFQSVYYLYQQDVQNMNAQVVALLVQKRYISNSEDGLLRTIRTTEFSDLMDLRMVLMKVNQDDGDNMKTYVNVLNSVSSQTITFDVVALDNSDPSSSDATCEGFASYQDMYYEAIFERPATQEEIAEDPEIQIVQYTVEPKEISSGETQGGIIISIEFEWDREMGIMKDPKWDGNTTCILKATTPSGFIYQIPEFKLTGPSQASGSGDGKYKTTTEISNNN